MMQNQTQPKGLSRKTYEIPVCGICLDDLTSELVSLPCGHVFHQICMLQNFESSSLCPFDRKRMVKANMVDLKYSLKCNDEAEEQIQAFYNSLSENERQNVITLMNQFESQTREFTSIKKHRDELIILCREQSDKLNLLEKLEKELSQNNKKLSDQKEKLTQQVNLYQYKIKEHQDKIDTDQITLEKLKQVVAELRSIKSLKDKLDQGGTNEDRLIEDIKKNKTMEEQSKKFYEMLRMKKGSCEELKQENQVLQNQLKSCQSELEFLKGENKSKLRQINEQREIAIKEKEKYKKLNEAYMDLKELNQQKMAKLQQKIQNDKLNQNGLSNLDDLKISRGVNFNSVMEDENSNLSNITRDNIDQQLKLNNYSSQSKNELDSIQNPFNVIFDKNQFQDNENDNQYMNSSAKKADQYNKLNDIKQQDNSATIQYNNNEQLKQQNSLQLSNDTQLKQKRSFDSGFSFDQMKYKKQPKFESSIGKGDSISIGQLNSSLIFNKGKEVNPPHTHTSDIPTGGQGLFGIFMGKNSLLNKNQVSNRISSNSATTNQKQSSSLSDLFLKSSKNS